MKAKQRRPARRSTEKPFGVVTRCILPGVLAIAGFLACGTTGASEAGSGAPFPPSVPNSDSTPDPESGAPRIAKLIRHMKRSAYGRGDRWPVLYWGGIPDDDTLTVLANRNILPLAAGARYGSLNYNAGETFDYIKYLNRREIPAVVLMQGWVQKMFWTGKQGHRDAHLPPAKGVEVTHDDLENNQDFSCPAWVYGNPKAVRWQHDEIAAYCEAMKNAGAKPASIWIDFEAGPYLRNGAEGRDRVEPASREALKCPRCLKKYGREALQTPEGFAKVVDQARAWAIRRSFSDAVHQSFPRLPLGNFYAYPVTRRPPQAGQFPAYGWENSGLKVAQPRRYFVAGWGGIKDQPHADWSVFSSGLAVVSRCMAVIGPDERMVPWIGYLWGNAASLKKARAGGLIAAPHAYQEMVKHMMLRGAETVAIFSPEGLDAALPDAYDHLERKDLGAWLLNTLDVQTAYNEMLRFNGFLRRAKPMNLADPGGDPEDRERAIWSGVATGELALVRTVSFSRDLEKDILVFGKPVTLPFRTRGQFFWVRKSGGTTPVR